MGSFHTDCGISGLPIRSDDPVRFAIIKRYEYPSNNTCYSYCHYRFLSPLFSSTYNDYGSVDEKKIKDKALFDAFVAAASDGALKAKKFLAKYSEQEDKEIVLWMAHAWAVDFVLAIEQDEFRRRFRSREVHHIRNWSNPERDLDDLGERPRALAIEFQQIVRQLPPQHRDAIKEMAIEANDLGLNLIEIRKLILPNTTIGEPHWASPALIPWTKLVAEKAAQQFISEDDDD